MWFVLKVRTDDDQRVSLHHSSFAWRGAIDDDDNDDDADLYQLRFFDMWWLMKRDLDRDREDKKRDRERRKRERWRTKFSFGFPLHIVCKVFIDSISLSFT